ncbi:MAG: type IV secretion system DNA-binding domain-containing protein [Candidatus Berkiella sp.]
MSAFLNFTRGGQVQLHGIHMFWQVLVRFFKISLIVFMLFTTLLWVYQTKPYERYLLAQGVKAFLCQGNAYCPKVLKHKDPYGHFHRYTPKQLLSSPPIRQQLLLSRGAFWWSLKVSALTSWIIALLVAWLLTRFGAMRSQQQILRGATLATPHEYKRIVKRARQASRWTLSGVPLPKDAETQHILLCGSPGGGKSVCTHELLSQVRQAGQKALVYDIKGAFIPHYYREGKDIILNPLDERSPSWNLWQECNALTDYDSMASAIVPDISASAESFWTKAARTLLAITASQFKRRQDPRMKELIHHLFCSDLKEVESLLQGTLGSAMVGKDLEKGTRSVILTLVTYCKSLMYLKDEPQTPSFVIRDWVNNDKDDSWLFISSNQRLADTLKPLISLWLELAVNALLSLEESRNRRLWFFFDELASLQRLPSLEPVLSRGRGYGACFVGAIQDIHQLRDLYGDKAAEVLVSLFGTSLFFSTNNNHSAKWAAEQLGRAEFLEAREGYSMGAHQMRDGVTLSHQRRQEFVVMDSEIRHLKKREAFMVTAGGWPVTKLLFAIKKRLEKCPAIIERNLSSINHEVSTLEQKIETLTLDPLDRVNQKVSTTSSAPNEANSNDVEEQQIDLF